MRRGWQEAKRERRRGDAGRAALGESKYNYTKVSRNTETESRGNRRVSLKLESCFETTRLPCRLQPRHRRALPFPNSRGHLSFLRVLPPSCCVPCERAKQKGTFPRRLQKIAVKEKPCWLLNAVEQFLRFTTPRFVTLVKCYIVDAYIISDAKRKRERD